MPNSSDEKNRGGDPDTDAAIDPGLVLVMVASPIDRIVVSRISERAGYRTVARAADDPEILVAGRLPALVILDGGDVDGLVARIAGLRRPAGGGRPPRLILLGNGGPASRQPPGGDGVDAVVARPITPDRLQPIIRDLMDGLKG